MKALIVTSFLAIGLLGTGSASAYCRFDWEPFDPGEIPVYFHEDLDGIGATPLPLEAVVDQLRVAIRAWNEHAPTGAYFRLVGVTASESIAGAIVVRREPFLDDIGRFYCGGNNVLACAGPATGLADNGPLEDQGGIVRVRPTVSWTTNPGDRSRYMLAHVLTHELGHLLTLDHPEECGAGPYPITIMFGADQGLPAAVHRDDVQGVRSVHGTSGFVLEDMRYSSNGDLGTWTRSINSLDAPGLPLTVSNTTPTLATWGDRRVLAYPSIAAAGDMVAVKPGRGDTWGSFHEVTALPIGVSHAPVGVSVIGDDILVAWHHEPASGTAGYVAVSHDFGLSFSVPIELRALVSPGVTRPFVTFSTTGYHVEYMESLDSWIVFGTDRDGQVVNWRVDRATGTPSPGLVNSAVTQQRPSAVCGRGGRRLDPRPGFPFPLECVLAFGGGSPVQALQYMPFVIIGGPGDPPSLLGGPIFETNLRIEFATSMLWRTEAVVEPLWFGQTFDGFSNVVLFKRTTDPNEGDPWRGASIVPIAITGVSKPLTATSLGLTEFGNDDVLQFVAGEIFP